MLKEHNCGVELCENL